MNILVTVPNQHWLHKEVCAVLMRLQMDGRHRLRFEWPSHKPYENNLHHIVADFVTSGCDFWLSMDADNPPINNPLDLVELDKDILGLPTPIYHWEGKPGERPIYWNGYDYDSSVDAYREHQPQAGLQRVDAIGTGCFLMHHRVFEHPGMQGGCFSRKLHANGTVHKGNDMSFCERARARGFEIWCHYDYPCRHYNANIELATMNQAIKGLWENPCG